MERAAVLGTCPLPPPDMPCEVGNRREGLCSGETEVRLQPATQLRELVLHESALHPSRSR